MPTAKTFLEIVGISENVIHAAGQSPLQSPFVGDENYDVNH